MGREGATEKHFLAMVLVGISMVRQAPFDSSFDLLGEKHSRPNTYLR